MKIEKINDHQIKCTLTKEDLADRELKISELAYGTDKAKDLFRDMMRQANLKFGFEANDIPLMIEAVPLNSDSIVLIITKVEDPDELDTRFSKFAPSVHDSENEDDEEDENTDSDVMDLFHKIREQVASSVEEQLPDSGQTGIQENRQDGQPVSASHIFTFSSIHELLKPVDYVNTAYQGDNFLYKDPETGHYLLLVTKSQEDSDSFNRICNTLSEYGKIDRTIPAREAYFAEHFEFILGPHALRDLKLDS